MHQPSPDSISGSPVSAEKPLPPSTAALPPEARIPDAIRELASGNASGPALNGIAKVILPALERYLSSRWAGLDDPEFVAGEVLATVLAKLESFDASKGTLLSWSIGMARRKAFTAWREQNHGEDVETQYERKHRERFHLKTRPDAALKDALLRAVLSLPEADHYLLHLHMVEGVTLEAAARQLNIPAELARKKKQRLLEALGKIAGSAPGGL